MNPELFHRVGITPPKGCLLYGPPGTGKTLLARAVAKQLDANFLKVVSSAIVDKYIGESARLIREMFGEIILNLLIFVCLSYLGVGNYSINHEIQIAIVVLAPFSGFSIIEIAIAKSLLLKITIIINVCTCAISPK